VEGVEAVLRAVTPVEVKRKDEQEAENCSSTLSCCRRLATSWWRDYIGYKL
jgi:hypothetical protein